MLWVAVSCFGLLWVAEGVAAGVAVGCCGLLWVAMGVTVAVAVAVGCSGSLWVRRLCCLCCLTLQKKVYVAVLSGSALSRFTGCWRMDSGQVYRLPRYSEVLQKHGIYYVFVTFH